MMRMKGSAMLAAGTCLIALAAPAHAQERAFNIPAGDLRTALDSFGRQSEKPIIYKVDEVSGLRTSGFRGTATPPTALQKILAGSGFVGSFDRTGAVAIFKRGNGQGGATARQASRYPADGGDLASTEHAPSVAEGQVESSEIIVTAQKRRERLIDTPQSVTVLTGESLARRGATQLRDFADLIPGLTVQSAGAGFTQLSLRGVTTGYDTSATVALYIDDVPYGSSNSFAQGARSTLDVGLFDVDQIDVQRGPQGTLYGASSIGGLVKYVTKKPSVTELGGEVAAGVSSTRYGGVSYNVAGAINLPMSEMAALRVSGFQNHDGGYIDNVALGRKDVNRSDVYGGRLDFLVTPADALSIRLGAFLQNIDRDGVASADYTPDGEPIYGSLLHRRFIAEPFKQKIRLLSGTVSYNFGRAALTSVTSYQKSGVSFVADLSPRYVPAFAPYGPFGAVGLSETAHTSKFTQEVRLTGNTGRPLEWIVGGYYTREISNRTQDFILLSPALQSVVNTLYHFRSPTKFREIAAFGDVTYRLSDKFDVSAGVRYADNAQTYTQIGSGTLVGSRPPRSSGEDVFTYLANARYHLSRDATAYVRYATGYRPGGPNFVVNDPTTGIPVGPETFEADRLKSYEAGIKARTADRTFEIDFAGYHIDWDNIHVLTSRGNANTGSFSVIANAAGGAKVTGAELTLIARPSPHLTVNGAFAWQNARMAEADLDLKADKGERLPNVPRFTAAINADYVATASRLRPSLGATLRFVSDRKTGFARGTAPPPYNLPDYTALDLRAGIDFGRFTGQFFLRNVLDARGELNVPTTLIAVAGPRPVSIMQPRTLGFSVRTRF